MGMPPEEMVGPGSEMPEGPGGGGNEKLAMIIGMAVIKAMPDIIAAIGGEGAIGGAPSGMGPEPSPVPGNVPRGPFMRG